jgi:cytochrome P450
MPFDFDPYDSAVIDDPYPAYQYLQDNDPVHHSHALRSWILTRYEDVRPGLNDPRLSADRITPYLVRIYRTNARKWRPSDRFCRNGQCLWIHPTTPGCGNFSTANLHPPH